MNRAGQSLVEYVLLLFVVVSTFILVARGLDKIGVSSILMKPLTQSFAKAYRYGHPEASGFEDGETPFRHPRYIGDGQSKTRIFLSPSDEN